MDEVIHYFVEGVKMAFRPKLQGGKNDFRKMEAS